jgi:hypothetical protein
MPLLVSTRTLDGEKQCVTARSPYCVHVADEFQRTETDYDDNGIKTVVEYRMDDQGRRVKVITDWTVVRTHQAD